MKGSLVLLAVIVLAVGLAYVFPKPQVDPCGAPVGGSNPGQMICPRAQPR